MIIPHVDTALERLLRRELDLPESLGDVSFDPPSGTWSAQLNRITVNLFLFGVGRSPQPPRPAVERVIEAEDGTRSAQRRPPVPMLQLHYLVSAWAGTVRDEHQLIGDALSCLLQQQALPPDLLPAGFTGGVQLAVAHHDNNRAKDVWSTVGGAIKPSFELVVTTAGDALPFEDLAPLATRVAPRLGAMPDRAAPLPAGSPATGR